MVQDKLTTRLAHGYSPKIYGCMDADMKDRRECCYWI